MRQLRGHGASGGFIQAYMRYKVLKHEVGVAALDPHPLQIPIDSFVQPHVNGIEPSNTEECDGIGRCRRVWCRV